MKAPVIDRTKYLKPINRFFNRSFSSLDEYKSEAEFQKILNDFVTLETVKKAIERAKAIRQENEELNRKIIINNNFKFFKDNPDTTVQDVVSRIFDLCCINYS